MTQIQMQQEFNEIKKLLHSNFLEKKEVLTSKEVVTYLNISYSLLSKLSAAGKIPSHQPTNGLKFYFREELHEWIRSNKIMTEEDALALLKKNNRRKRPVKHGLGL